MITNKDLEIENISYTNKDFGQIYPELVDQGKALTNKWDPSQTNESDPGIVILKLGAFLADKINYNIDKNTLEQFITSATQESSVRKLADMMAYSMRYYRSATTEISFRYSGDLLSNDQESSESTDDPVSQLHGFTLKAFDTTFKTEDDIIYTLLEDINVDYYDRLDTGKKAIQGELKQLTVLSNDDTSNLIQIYNLDDDNRVYFPDAQVAENGIFINKQDGIYDPIKLPDVWHRVDNLNDQELGKRVFKFGYDSKKGYPYIQFPTDISDLIGDGLTIDYIVSQGVLGKVLNNKLSKFDKTKIVSNGSLVNATLSEDNYTISNSTSAGAEDPETINEVVSNFNKSVGTFNTLVSCKDYSNYLNHFEYDDNSRLVSQVTVCDVRTDPNLSREIFTRDETAASYYIHDLIDNNTADLFKLYLHGTAPVNSDVTTEYLYNRTYNAISSSEIINIDSELSQIKTINHFFGTPKGTDIIIGDYTLKVNISPKYKLNSSEQLSVKNNVKEALFKAFNASELDFGQEIPYDSIIDVILNADSRIKNVNMSEPEVKFSVRDRTLGKVIPLNTVDEESKEYLTSLVVNNIIAGRLPLYKQDNSLHYSWDMDLSSADISHKYMCAILAEIAVEEDQELNENESIQLLEESYVTDIAYPYGILYSFYSSTGTSGQTVIIPAGKTYELQENEYLYINYTDSSNNKVFKTYQAGDIIKPNFDIVNNSGNPEIDDNVGGESKRASKYIDWNQKKELTLTLSQYNALEDKTGIIPMFSISTNEQIDVVKLNSYELGPTSNCFWYIKPKVNKDYDGESGSELVLNEDNELLFSYSDDIGNYYILEEGEFFIYPNDDMTSLNILGAGTKLRCNKSYIARKNTEYIDLDELQNSIADEDVGTFKKSFKWEQLATDTSITIIQNTISTYIKGDKINSFTFDDSSTSITSDWKDGLTALKINDEDIVISPITRPIIRSVLSVVGSADKPQKVLGGQSVTLYKADKPLEDEDVGLFEYTAVTVNQDQLLQVSPAIDGYNDMIVLQDIQYITDENGIIKPYIVNNRYMHTAENYSALAYGVQDSPASDTASYLVKTFSNTMNGRGEHIIGYSEDLANTYKTNIAPGLNLYAAYFDMVSDKSVVKKLVSLNDTVDLTYFKAHGDSGKQFFLSDPLKLEVYPFLEPLMTAESGRKALIEQLNDELEGKSNFDIIGEKNPYKYISSYDPLFSFFDANNIYNELTIARIDFDNSEFNFIGSFR